MSLPEIPYDPWFHDEPIHPHDFMPIATNDPIDASPSSVEPQDKPEDIHEKMYKMATQKHSPWIGGGSENFLTGNYYT